MKFNSSTFCINLLVVLILISAGCISPKDTVTSRSMQNLTARYNIVYNANILLNESSKNIETGFIDNYDQLLTIYKEPSEALAAAETTNLDSIIQKANNIVNEKVNSHYVDDAYLLIAKANYLKGLFFNASEFFNYIDHNYRLEKETRQEALLWNARALMQLENLKEASVALDTALKHIESSKKLKSDIYAAYSQFLISTGKEPEAITMLQKAIEEGSTKQNEIRWTFILAQLQQEQKQVQEAYSNFTKVVKSNASFEMAFHANLNRIRIEDEQKGKSVDRVTRLESLLKDDKNKDFIDQIYYQIAKLYEERNKKEEAIKNYNTSVRKTTLNINQKGLSYLSLAEINFNDGNYVDAKNYYDSTLSALSPKYPGYDLIRRKSNNLELLANRYRSIAREDTLQMLARLPEAQREDRIAELVRQQSQSSIAQEPAVNNLIAGIDNPSVARSTEGKFYFNNSTAMSQGFADFKRKWGTRRLEDNWRRIAKSAEETANALNSDPDAPLPLSTSSILPAINPDTLRQNYLRDMPLTATLIQQSNQRIAESYYDIANFYKDELKDSELATSTFEELLKHSPETTYNLPVYYNLYRLYEQPDSKKSAFYKDLILSKYPESPFAKVIKDPNYSRATDQKEFALNNSYNQLFDLYAKKNYAEMVSSVKSIEQDFPENKLAPQIAYLNAMAVGHTQKLTAFETALQGIIQKYPDDQLITPLVKQHLQYVQANKQKMASRKTALLDYDPLEPGYFEEPPIKPAIISNQPATIEKPIVQAPVSNDPDQSPLQTAAELPPAKSVITKTPDPVTPPAKPATPAPGITFTLPGEAQYYFVVNILDPALTLSSSRFGIGQFNRTRYAGVPLKHQLQEINNENQLILVGVFNTYEDVKAYEIEIRPQLKDIIKVPVQQYTTFVITKASLDKLLNRQLINTYIEFYKNSN